MQKLSLGIIGVGNMGMGHIHNIASDLVPEVEVSAVCDIDADALARAKALLPAAAAYSDAEKLFDHANLDAVLIATPHYMHPVYAIEAFKHGLHVLTEKPAGVYTRAVREMNEAAERSGKVFGIMYNQRTNPVYQKLRELIQSGELGEIKRTNWIITSWYRSQAYYNSGGWRATWSGEGGGVLLNQDPHQLDLWQWTCGMPVRVRTFMQFGKQRDIEVENDVTAYVEYDNGATGLFVTSTHEAPGTNRFEVSCDMGRLVIENSALTFDRNRVSEPAFNAKLVPGAPEAWHCEIPTATAPNGHAEILKNFAGAVLRGEKLLAPGVEGIRGLTLSNAMHLSAWTDRTIDIATLDEDLFYGLLQERIRDSKFVKTVTGGTSGAV
ncbi:MAG: Gfo/Idh/MocA family oxidoreductase [Clostridiaceae bacterium]|nr:Gfo/Idh/MocA family oxidoreductase [Clostridiaceae bacterium]